MQTAKEEGFGGEGASIAEAFHALSLGIRPEDVVFDSPCKTKVTIIWEITSFVSLTYQKNVHKNV